MNTKIDIGKIKKLGFLTGEKTNWQKGIFWALLLSLFAFCAAVSFQFFKGPSQEIEQTVGEEISSSNIIFDAKTLENLNKRQQPPANVQPSVGKNPFIPF